MATLSNSNRETIQDFLRDGSILSMCDYPMNFERDFSNGWKVSVQGNTTEDTLLIFNALIDYLLANDISVKFALQARHALKFTVEECEDRKRHLKAQSHKVATIYCPNDYDILVLCDNVHRLLSAAGYEGWKGVEHPNDYTFFADGIYYRNDMDENGKYIPAVN